MLYDNNQDFPIIDKEFLCDIFKVITKRISNKDMIVYIYQLDR